MERTFLVKTVHSDFGVTEFEVEAYGTKMRTKVMRTTVSDAILAGSGS